jgi:type IV pilus assembly protein PilM
MFPFRLTSQPSLVGLDIQATEVCLLQMRQVKQELCILSAAASTLPHGVIQDGKIIEFDKVHTTIHQLVKQTKTRGHFAAIALPGANTLSREVSLPKLSQREEYEAEIDTHLEKYLPGVTEKICFDYIIQKEGRDLQQALIVAAKSDMMAAYVNVVNQSGLRLKIVDVDWYALTRAMNACLDTKNKMLGLLDIGIDAAKIIFIHDGNLIFKRQVSLTNDIHSSFDILKEQLNHAIQLCYAAFQLVHIDQFYLSGHDFKDIDKLQSAIGIPIERLNVSSPFLMSQKINKNDALTIMERSLISVGLIMRGCTP